MKEYMNVVEMPGVITTTTSYMLKGNQVSWEVQPMAMLFADYEMSVVSRVVNNWAFIVTGVRIPVSDCCFNCQSCEEEITVLNKKSYFYLLNKTKPVANENIFLFEVGPVPFYGRVHFNFLCSRK